MDEALYLRTDEATYSPTGLTGGPWQADAQHGGPPAALLAGIADRMPSELPMHLARITVELLRPVPVAPLVATTAVVRPGRRVQLVAVELAHDGTAVARATGLRIRQGEVTIPQLDRGGRLPAPESAHPPRKVPAGRYVTEAMEVRFLHGDFTEPGPGTAWLRLRVAVVGGQETRPVERVAAAADFGNGISAELAVKTHLYINPDLTIYLHRDLDGEWVGMEATSFLATNGVGVAETALYDGGGRVGRSVQALFVEDR